MAKLTKTTEVEVVKEDVIDVTVPEVEEKTEVETTTPEVEIPEVKTDVDVDVKSAEVKESNRPNGNVKIRMRVDHKCCIAMERYDLKAGKTYTVPENVKEILNRAGLLAPL